MKCSHCGSENNNVIDTRMIDDNRRRRRYMCFSCDHRFTTYEIIEDEFEKRYQDMMIKALKYRSTLLKIAALAERGCDDN